MSIDIMNLKGIKKGKLFKKGLALITAITIMGSTGGCSNDNSDTNDYEIRISTSFDAGKIENDGMIDEETLQNLYISYGFMDLINDNCNLDYFVCFTEKQREALNECVDSLKIYFDTNDEKISKTALDKTLKAIEKFYNGEKPVDVMQEVLYHYIPGEIYVSADNDHFENNKGEVSSLSIFKHRVTDDDSVQPGALDFYKLYMLMCKGTLTNKHSVSDAIYNINNMLHICGEFYDNPLYEFKDQNNKSYLGNKTMLAELITIDGALDVMYNDGVFDNLDIVYSGHDYLDVRIDGVSFYEILLDVNDEIVRYLIDYLENDQITSDVILNNGLTPLILSELLKQEYGYTIILDDEEQKVI